MSANLQKYIDKKFYIQFDRESIRKGSSGDLVFKISNRLFLYVDSSCIRRYDFNDVGFYDYTDIFTKSSIDKIEFTDTIIAYLKYDNNIWTFYDYRNNQKLLEISGEHIEFFVNTYYFGDDQEELEWASDSE